MIRYRKGCGEIFQMKRQSNTCFVKMVACFLIIILVVPYAASAAMPDTVEPCASDYLISYTSYICHMGGGDLEIWYRVTGAGTQFDLGVLTIQLYESSDQSNWSWVDTFQHYDYEQMLAHNTAHHMSHVDYQGTEGKYYKALVTIWGGSETDGDARYIWTDVEYATPSNP